MDRQQAVACGMWQAEAVMPQSAGSNVRAFVAQHIKGAGRQAAKRKCGIIKFHCQWASAPRDSAQLGSAWTRPAQAHQLSISNLQAPTSPERDLSNARLYVNEADNGSDRFGIGHETWTWAWEHGGHGLGWATWELV